MKKHYNSLLSKGICALGLILLFYNVLFNLLAVHCVKCEVSWDCCVHSCFQQQGHLPEMIPKNANMAP